MWILPFLTLSFIRYSNCLMFFTNFPPPTAILHAHLSFHWLDQLKLQNRSEMPNLRRDLLSLYPWPNPHKTLLNHAAYRNYPEIIFTRKSRILGRISMLFRLVSFERIILLGITKALTKSIICSVVKPGLYSLGSADQGKKEFS
jgi:hypothetical protein